MQNSPWIRVTLAGRPFPSTLGSGQDDAVVEPSALRLLDACMQRRREGSRKALAPRKPAIAPSPPLSCLAGRCSAFSLVRVPLPLALRQHLQKSGHRPSLAGPGFRRDCLMRSQ